ncbi:2Fe-2S iron-sulfur cluster-binding protein [Paenalcaligenes niemegkensis]|uniref:(2Fe-2S)-binding protein n=1 Tax=Paenalcaligenes niemegkensis TaxID=2895469 RepID=UPI001EE96367|nr:2Fe-2S iron-sulfur cluster-binding protein [Paenalcaligenes niemegkensis]MCQ9616628.1 2Fe-2S iron-sulfur cluster-binding protein [Paenalcaligenes niemegkensis]
MDALPLTFSVNGQPRMLSVDASATLLDVLREQLRLSGTKKGCDHGQCGACTVLLDGRRINACLTLAVMHQNSSVTTIEGLADGDVLHDLQKAFIEHDAFQCGYCTPGQICSAVGLLNEGHANVKRMREVGSDEALREEIREFMSGNLCRCGAYTNIVDAIVQVLQDRERS